MTSVFKKQYVLSSYRLELPDMQEIKISEGYLYVHQKLNLTLCQTKDASRAIVLGNAFCADEEGKSIEKDISLFCKQDLREATKYWTGRWVLICEDELITDACGLMSAFYTKEDSGWLVSSSLAVLAQITNKPIDKMVNSYGLNWQILPHSRINGVRTLLCTQKLVFSKTEIEADFSPFVKDYREKSTEEKCKAVSNILVCACKNINAFSGKKTVVALTGGKDSRLTFSALLKSGVPFSAYTAEHKNISSSDKTIPAKLAKHFGIEHKYIRKGKFSVEKFEDYKHFTCGNSDDADAQFYACGQFSSFDKDTILLRSGIFEAGQRYARSYTTPDIEGFVCGMLSYYPDLKNSQEQKNAFSEWKKYVIQNPINSIDIRDRFYIEQRVGGWAAAIEQSLDINEFTSIQIANCAELVSILLSCNEEERKQLALSYETIKLLKPETLRLAINKVTFYDKFKRISNILRHPIKKYKNFVNKRNSL